MKIYTKTGDAGTTGLFAGPRVFKNDTRLQAYGSVDELNSVIGVVICNLPSLDDPLLAHLRAIQSDLFAVGAELATPDPQGQGMCLLAEDRIHALEASIDKMEADLPPLKNFVLPGGCPASANLHWARTVCRRAEREVVSLTLVQETADYSRIIVFLNRLSDWLFVAARHQNHLQGVPDEPWQRPV